MKNYLIVAIKNNDGYWNTQNFSVNDTLGYEAIYNAITSSTDIKEINNENCTILQKGFITFNELNSLTDSDYQKARVILNIRICDICGCIVNAQDVRSDASRYFSDEDKRYCKHCLEVKNLREELTTPRNFKINLSGYHSTGGNVKVINGIDENYTLDDVVGLGIEMEYNHGTRSDRAINCTEDFYKIANPRSRNRVFRCEQDYTVSGEIISNIFTEKSFEAFDWEILTNQLKKLKNDEKQYSVGFHVHISKTALGDNARKQALNFLKLNYFFSCYKDDIVKASGRLGEADMGWCRPYTLEEIANIKERIENTTDDNVIWNRFTSSHGSALIVSGNTIEIRIGKSTNSAEKIKHWIRLWWYICKNIDSVKFEKVFCLGKVLKLVPNDTMNYWRKNGCFMTTNALDTRGVSVNA